MKNSNWYSIVLGFWCKTIKNVTDFHLFLFVLIRFKSSKNSLHTAFKWERGQKFWTDLKKNMDFVFFPSGLSNFELGAWFPFDEGQSTRCIVPAFKWWIRGLKDFLQITEKTGLSLESFSAERIHHFKFSFMY